MPTTLINPLDEASPATRAPAKRLQTLASTTIGLLDISKPGGSVFLNRLEKLLRDKYQVKVVIREVKPTFTKPAPEELLAKFVGADAVVEALAD